MVESALVIFLLFLSSQLNLLPAHATICHPSPALLLLCTFFLLLPLSLSVSCLYCNRMHTTIVISPLIVLAVTRLAAYVTNGISHLSPISIAADLLLPLLSFCNEAVGPMGVSPLFFSVCLLHLSCQIWGSTI
jgi:hypothetical protein